MTLLVPDGSFSIGTSSTTAPAASSSKVDMSLDDMIKARRSSRVRKPAATTATTVQKSVGRAKSKRSAAANARRGIQTYTKPTAMDTDKEIYRQQRKKGPSSTGGPNKKDVSKTAAAGTKGLKQPGGRRLADVKTKAKLQKKQGVAPPKPSRRAISAAVAAMKTHGFAAPPGNRLVISFEPVKGKDGSNTQNDQNKKGQQQKSSSKKSNSSGGGRKKK